jgi:hypothetical protein
MMVRNFYSMLAVALLASASLLAHDAKLHKGKATEGELVSISGSAAVLKTAAGNVNVTLNKDTKYEMGNTAVDVNHFKKGDKVSVIGTKLANGELVAKEVLMSAAPAAKSATKSTAKATAKTTDQHTH